jgi:hypothetical protein
MAAIIANEEMPPAVARPKPVAAPAPATGSETTRITERVTAGLEMVSKQLESQSLNALSSGFFFAAALAWMDVSRSVIGQFIKGNKNGVLPMTLTALATTLLSILVFLIITSISPKIERPPMPVYAVVGR